MEFGITFQSVVPVRAGPSHLAEQVTQILFGELFLILFKEKEWRKIRLEYDNYEGWIHSSQVTLLDEREYLRLLDLEPAISLDLVQLVSNETKGTIIPVLLGSSLPGFDGKQMVIGGMVFSFDGLISGTLPSNQALTPQERRAARQTVMNDALLYLNAPYAWGGRSPFCIDCSGLTQMVYKLKKIRLLRDASQQAIQGEPLNFISEAEPGDLVFFDKEEGKITHAGLMLDSHRILHASGKVRIDAVDHEGIFNEEEQKYTHRLRLIRRII